VELDSKNSQIKQDKQEFADRRGDQTTPEPA